VPLSPSDSSHSANLDELLDQIIDEVAERVRAGEKPTVGEYVERYPELAEELQDVLPSLCALEVAVAESTAGAGSSLPASVVQQVEPGRVLGDYELVREIGRGGMGIVWKARQVSLQRSVALKIFPWSAPAGASSSSSSLGQRFDLEAQAAARLDHPHIVSVFDIGESEGVRFYAMQFVDGVGLDAVIAALREDDGTAVRAATVTGRELAEALRAGEVRGQTRSDSFGDSSSQSSDGGSSSASPDAVRSASEGSSGSSVIGLGSSRYVFNIARLAGAVADALSHAHAAGVVHRDIKPSNLLLDRSGKVWVADFGLAKLLDSDGLTQSGDAVGTLRYMSPERFSGWSDARSDVYSLGATLYELITLRPPFVSPDRARLVQSILDSEVPRLRSTVPGLPRDFETIILKALAKEPGDRYASCREMREDLERFVNGRPILARRATTVERAWLFARRNPLIASLGVVLFVVAVVATYAAARLEKVARDLDEEKTHALENLWSATLERGRASRTDARPLVRRQLLDALAEAAKYRANFELRNEAIAALARTGLTVQLTHPAKHASAVSPSGRYVASAGDDRLRLYDLGEKREVYSVPTGQTGADARVQFSPDGKYIVRVFWAKEIEVLRTSDGASLLTIPDPFANLAFHPDGRTLVACIRRESNARRKSMAWNLESGEEVSAPMWARGSWSIDYSPDGTKAAVIDPWVSEITVVDASTGDTLTRFARDRLPGHPELRKVSWHPSGERLVIWTAPLTVWELERDRIRERHPATSIHNIEYSKCGRYLVHSDWAGTTHIRDAELGNLLAKVDGWTLGLRDDGQAIYLLVGGEVQIAAVERSRSYQVFATPTRDATVPTNRASFASLHPSDPWLAVGRPDGVQIWNVASEKLVKHIPCGLSRVAWRPDGSELFTFYDGRQVDRWPLRERDGRLLLGPPQKAPIDGAYSLRFSRDGRWLATYDRSHVMVLDLEERVETRRFRRPRYLNSVCVSSDAKYVAGGNWNGRHARVWNVETAKLEYEWDAQGAAYTIFLNDDRLVMSTRSSFRVLEPGTWKILREVHKDSNDVGLIRGHLSGDGRVLALSWRRGVFRLFDVERDFQPLADISADAGGQPLTIHASGHLIGSTLVEGAVKVWRLDELRSELRELGLDWDSGLPPTPLFADEGRAIEVDLGKFDPSKEIARAELARDRDPSDGTRRLHWLRLARAAGLWEDLIEYDEGVLKGGFSVPHANSLAWTLVTGPKEIRDPRRAIELAKRALQIEQPMRLVGRLGATLQIPGIQQSSREAQQKYIDTQRVIGLAKLRLGDWDAAITALEEVFEWRGASRLRAYELYALAISYRRKGDEARAKSLYDLAGHLVEELDLEWDESRAREAWSSGRRAWVESECADLRRLRLEAATEFRDGRPLPRVLRINRRLEGAYRDG